MLRTCSHHEIPMRLLVETFYIGLIGPLRASIDVATGGMIMRKSPEEVYDLFEEIANSNYQWPMETSFMGKGVHACDVVTVLTAKIHKGGVLFEIPRSWSQHTS